jgi:hypothetical protein
MSVLVVAFHQALFIASGFAFIIHSSLLTYHFLREQYRLSSHARLEAFLIQTKLKEQYGTG